MPFTVEDRILIKELRLHKGYNARQLKMEFPNKLWSMRSLRRLIAQIDNTGSADRKKGSGQTISVRTAENIAAVEELVLSQEDAPRTHKSIRQISHETGISKTSVVRIIKKDLHLKCLKRRRAQELTEANRLTRLIRCKQLLKKYPEHCVPFIWFTDEKIFTVAPAFCSQNDRLYTDRQSKKRQLPAERVVHSRATFSKSLMVSVGVSAMGRTNMVFVEPGVKINGQYYREVVLQQQLLPDIRQINGEFFTFQQDNAPSHRARETVELLSRETPDFIGPYLWPPNSPDLNPVDYKIWSLLQDRVYRTAIRDVEHLKQRLVEEWSRIDQAIIDHAVNDWRVRLRACVSSAGGHFEHQLT